MTGASTTAFTSASWHARLFERAHRTLGAPPHAATVEAGRFLRRLDDDYQDFARKLEWIEQATFALPVPERAQGLVRASVKELRELGVSLAGALEAARDESVAPLFTQEAPLIRYLHGIYDWTEDLLDAFEDMARAARAGRVVPSLRYRRFSYHFTQIDPLTSAIHADVRRASDGTRADAARRALDARLEAMFWVASWLHMSLVRRFP